MLYENDIPSCLHEIWLGLNSNMKAACHPNDRPEGADPQPFVAEAEVGHTGGQYVRGEEFACGETRGGKQVICGTVIVSVPGHKRIVAIRRFARESLNSVWHPDPYLGLGWCDWAGQAVNSESNGKTIIGLTFKNWSHYRVRRFRLEVWVN